MIKSDVEIKQIKDTLIKSDMTDGYQRQFIENIGKARTSFYQLKLTKTQQRVRTDDLKRRKINVNYKQSNSNLKLTKARNKKRIKVKRIQKKNKK